MDEEMFTFFPHGIRALIVDDDQKFLKSAKMMLDLLHFKVATCGSPSSALRLLSDDGGLKDVDVVLADAHKVVASGFDLRAIVEPDLGIPVIYRGHPSKIQDSRNMEGQNVHQVASSSKINSGKHRANKRMSNTSNRPLCLDGRRRHESLAVANPTLNTSPCNPQLFTEHGGPSSIAGGSSSAVEQPSSFTAGAASNAAEAPFPWPAGNFCGVMAQVATPSEEQNSSGTNQNQASFPLLSFGPFPYQGPFPPTSGQDKITLDNPVGSLAPVSLNPCVAPPTESEIEALFASITDLPASENNVPTQDFGAVAAEAEQSEAAAMVDGLMDVPLDNDYLLGAGAAPVAIDDDILFPLEDILWPEGLMNTDIGGFMEGASGFLDGVGDDMGSSGQGTEGFSFLDDTL